MFDHSWCALLPSTWGMPVPLHPAKTQFKLAQFFAQTQKADLSQQGQDELALDVGLMGNQFLSQLVEY
jgi:hypothetical protein